MSDDIFGMNPAHKGKCEQCHEVKMVRAVKSCGDGMGGGSRGFFQICFDCYPEHVKFYVGQGRYQRVFYAPKGAES